MIIRWDLKVTLFGSQQILRGFFVYVCLFTDKRGDQENFKRQFNVYNNNVWKKKQSHEKRRNHHVRSRTFFFQTIQKTERGEYSIIGVKVLSMKMDLKTFMALGIGSGNEQH